MSVWRLDRGSFRGTIQTRPPPTPRARGWRYGLAETGQATYLRLHSGYPTDLNAMAGYPVKQLKGAEDGQWTRNDAVVSNGGSVRYAAAGTPRAAPAWWSLSLDAAGTRRLFVGQVSGTQQAVPAAQAFRIAPGQIAITVADA